MAPAWVARTHGCIDLLSPAATGTHPRPGRSNERGTYTRYFVSTTTLEDAKAALKKLKAGYRSRYLDMVRAVGNGKQIDAHTIAEFLDAAGIEFGQFETDVATHVKRIGWASEASEHAARVSKVAAAKAKVTELDANHVATITRLQAEVNSKIVPLNAEIAEGERLILRSVQAGHELRNTAPAELHERTQECSKRLGAAQQQLNKARADLEAFPGLVEKAKAEVAKCSIKPSEYHLPDKGTHNRDHMLSLWQRDLDRAKAAVPREDSIVELQEAVSAAAATVAELEREAAAIEAEFTKP